jgi:hypothetical protein
VFLITKSLTCQFRSQPTCLYLITFLPSSNLVFFIWETLDALDLFLTKLLLAILLLLSFILSWTKFHHITPILKSLHWFKITERIHYKLMSITYKCLLSDKPTYLRNLSTVQSTSTTRSSSVTTRSSSAITLKRPYNPSRLKVSSRSF